MLTDREIARVLSAISKIKLIVSCAFFPNYNVECVFPMVLVSILPQAENAPHFMTTSSMEYTPVLIPLFADLFLDRFNQSIRAFGSHFLAKFL